MNVPRVERSSLGENRKKKWKKRKEVEEEKRELGNFLFDLERSAKEILKKSNSRREAEAKRSHVKLASKRKGSKPHSKPTSLKRQRKKQNQTNSVVTAHHGLDVTLDVANPTSGTLPELSPRHVNSDISNTTDPPINSPSPQTARIQEVREKISEMFSGPQHRKRGKRDAVAIKQPKQPLGLPQRTQLAYSRKELKVPKCCYPGSLQPRPEHSVPRRLSLALWLDPTRRTSNERGMSKSIMHSLAECQNELQGPTNWSHVDLRLKYRDETRREQARQASLEVMAPTEFADISDQVVEIEVHPVHRDVLELVQEENRATIRITNARNRVKTFLVDLDTVWRVNRPRTMAWAEEEPESSNQKTLENNKAQAAHEAGGSNQTPAGDDVVTSKNTAAGDEAASSKNTPGDEAASNSTEKRQSSESTSSSAQKDAKELKYGVAGPLRGLRNRRDPHAHEDISNPQAQSVTQECALVNAVTLEKPPAEGFLGYYMGGKVDSVPQLLPEESGGNSQKELVLGELIGRTILPLGVESQHRVHATMYAPWSWTHPCGTTYEGRDYVEKMNLFHLKAYHPSTSESYVWAAEASNVMKQYEAFRQHHAFSSWQASALMLRSGALDEKLLITMGTNNLMAWEKHRNSPRHLRFGAIVRHPRVNYMRARVMCHVAFHPRTSTSSTKNFPGTVWEQGRLSYWLRPCSATWLSWQVHVPMTVVLELFPTLPEPWWCDAILFPSVVQQVMRQPFWLHGVFGSFRGHLSPTLCIQRATRENLMRSEESVKEQFVHQCCMLEQGAGGVGLVEYLERIQWVEQLSLKHQQRYLAKLAAEAHAAEVVYRLTDLSRFDSGTCSLPKTIPIVARLGCAHGPGFIPGASVGFHIRGDPVVGRVGDQGDDYSLVHHEDVIVARSSAVPSASMFGRSNPVLGTFFRNKNIQTAPVLLVVSQALDHPLCAPSVVAFNPSLAFVGGLEFKCVEGYTPMTCGSFYGYVMTSQVDVGLAALITVLSAAPTKVDIGGNKPERYSGHLRHLPHFTDRQFRQILLADITDLTQPNPDLEPQVFGISESSATLCVADTWPFRYTWHSHDKVEIVLVRERVAEDFRGVNYRVATVGGNDPLCFALDFDGYTHRGVRPMSRTAFFEMEMQRAKELEQERRANRTRAQLEIHRQRQAKAARERLLLQKTVKDKLLADSIKEQGKQRMKQTVGNRTEDWLARVADPYTKKAGAWRKWQAYMYMDSEARVILEEHRADVEKLQLALIAMGEEIKTAEELVEEEKELYLLEGTLFYHNKAENLFQWDQPRGWHGVACIQDLEDEEEDALSTARDEGEVVPAGETQQEDFDPAHGSLDLGDVPDDDITKQREDDTERAFELAKRVDQARRLRAIEFVIAGWLDHRADLQSPRESVAGRPPPSTGKAFNLTDVFREIDEMDTGLVNHEEFRLGLAQLGFEFSLREQESVLLKLDGRGLGMVDYFEFVDWLLNVPCRSSDAWFAVSTESRQALPSEWEAMRTRDKQVDSILEFRKFKDSESREYYYWNTKNNESTWRQPAAMTTALHLRRDSQELAEAQHASILAARAAAAAAESAARASDRSLNRLVSALASSNAFVDLLVRTMGWKGPSPEELEERQQALSGVVYDSHSESSDGEYASEMFSDDSEESSSEDGGGVSEGVVAERSVEDSATQSRALSTAVRDSVFPNGQIDESGVLSTQDFESRAGTRDFESRAGTQQYESQTETQDFESREGTQDLNSRVGTQQYESQTETQDFESRGATQSSERTRANSNSRRRRKSRTKNQVKKTRRSSKLTTPQLRDLGATLANEIKAMRETSGKAITDQVFGGKESAAVAGQISKRVDADKLLEKPGLGWRLLKPSKEATGFITRCSNPRTMGLKHALMTSNRPSLVGVVDASEVTHFSFNDFPPLNTMLLTDLVSEAARAAQRSAGQERFTPNGTSGDRGTPLLRGEEKVAKMLEDALNGNDNLDMLDMTHKAFLAVKNGKLDELEMLVDEGVRITERDENGNTMLHLAAQQGLKRISKYLLRKGADINAQNLSGNTVLHYCFEYSANDLAEYFISKGADDSLLNADGLTCYEGLSKAALDAL